MSSLEPIRVFLSTFVCGVSFTQSLMQCDFLFMFGRMTQTRFAPAPAGHMQQSQFKQASLILGYSLKITN